LGEQLFATVGQVLQARGLKLSTGTIVNATIIGAPSSTKNTGMARDPEMHQTRKGQQWFFGMKLHIGVDSRTGLAHRAVVTAANVHDKHPLPQLPQGNERRVYGDSTYASQKALIPAAAPQAKDFTNQRVCKGEETEEGKRAKNRNKFKARARVEHMFAVALAQQQRREDVGVGIHAGGNVCHRSAGFGRFVGVPVMDRKPDSLWISRS
jgi:IS5 family transposase